MLNKRQKYKLLAAGIHIISWIGLSYEVPGLCIYGIFCWSIVWAGIIWESK